MLVSMKPGEYSLLGKLKFPTGLFWFATTVAGFAGFAGGAESMWLGGESPLFNGNNYYDNGYAFRAITPIKDLPKRIVFKPGEVSLIADPTDKRGAYMVVYLVNDTDRPIPRIIGELNKVSSQVRFGGYWFSREPMKAGCGTVPEPRDLPARHALALGGMRDDLGDIGGEIRYGFHVPGRIIFSEPLRGQYFRKNLQTVMVDECSVFFWGRPFDEEPIGSMLAPAATAESLEAFCVRLELTRNYRLDLKTRSELWDWILERTAKHDATPEQSVAIKAMKTVLSRPWMVENDAQTLADRCVAALEAKTSKIYGSPERRKDVVWRYLADYPLRGLQRFRHDAISADEKSLARIVTLAKATLSSGDEVLADAAAEFLASATTDELFPSEGFHQFISTGRPSQIRSGINGLAHREKAEEIGPWLLERAMKKDPEARIYYRMIRTRLRGPEKDWEESLIHHFFDEDPLETLAMLSVYPRIDAVRKLPAVCDGPLRKFLNDQLSADRRHWWNRFTERNKLGQLKPEEELYCQGLSHGIRLMDSWNNSDDTPTLLAFLDHPAADISKYSDGSLGTIFFTARDTARSCLVRRKIKIPDTLVTRIDIPKPVPPRDMRGDFERFVLRYQSIFTAAGTIVLLASTFYWWRIKRKGRRQISC
jgi:hypothetical protein